jgi:phosphotransferase system enzyme I (PtsI)
MITLKGIAASPGVAIGKAIIYKKGEVMVQPHEITNFEEELERFRKAVEVSKKQLKEAQDKTAREIGESEAKIFQAQSLILEDPSLIREVTKSIEEKVNAETAVRRFIEKYVAIFKTMENAYIKARAADIQDVGDRIVNNLLGISVNPLAGLQSKAIIITRDLSPSDTAQMNKELVLGFATDAGGLTSHTAIMARALGIPAVVGLGNVVENVKTGDDLIIDGTAGIVIINPTNEKIAQYEKEKTQYDLRQKEFDSAKYYAAETTDGRKVEVAANVGSPEEMDIALSYGAEGIGLFRTEFSYLNRDSLPTEEELFKLYKKAAEIMKEKTVIIRTLDVGGDKYLPYLKMPQETNPFLGWRGIRICLSNPDLFKTQLRAIFRASAFGNLKIMFPMISSVEEVQAAKKLCDEIKDELATQGVPYKKDTEIGIMIETPSAAVTSDLLAKEVGFFSIGTNDLIQYSMAVDRTNEKVAYLYEPLHPSVLRLVKSAIENAHKANKWIGMCGEMAGDPLCVPILIGLGLDELSVAAFSIPKVKKIVRSVSCAEAKKIARKALGLNTANEVRNFAKDILSELLK